MDPNYPGRGLDCDLDQEILPCVNTQSGLQSE